MIVGKIVQINSINWPSSKNRLIYLLKHSLIIRWVTNIVIIAKTNNVWSWKKESCSINGDELSCKNDIFQVAISKKRRIFIYGV